MLQTSEIMNKPRIQTKKNSISSLFPCSCSHSSMCVLSTIQAFFLCLCVFSFFLSVLSAHCKRVAHLFTSHKHSLYTLSPNHHNKLDDSFYKRYENDDCQYALDLNKRFKVIFIWFFLSEGYLLHMVKKLEWKKKTKYWNYNVIRINDDNWVHLVDRLFVFINSNYLNRHDARAI